MTSLIASAAITLAAAAAAGGQEPRNRPQSTPEAAALGTCTALAEEGKGAQAAAPGRAAESLYRKRLARNPRDIEALLGTARAVSQCLLPSAGFMQQGELSSEAMELLDRALAIEPGNWMARFVLASIADRSPSFLGRGTRAAQEYDALLRLQGDRTDDPLFARVFAARGRQLSTQGQVDSARTLWARGARLFPNDPVLQSLARPPADSDSTARKAPTGGTGTVPPQSAPPHDSLDVTRTPQPAPLVLAAVEVVVSAAPRVTLPSVSAVSRSQVLMTAGGAADVLQAVQMQPGATRVTEGGDIYTRGGDAGETSLLVNGGRLLGLGRFEGLNGSLFGAIEPFVVKSVRYSSGGFSARHGNALSGVLEIETDGRPSERQTRAGLSLVQASGTFRAPVQDKAGGWISARVSYTGALLRTHGRTEEFDGAPHSEEMIGSFIVHPTPLTEIRATAIVERDASTRYVTAAGWRGPFDSNGGTRALLLSSRWIASRMPLVVRGSIAVTTRSIDWSFGVLSRDRDEGSMTARVDAEWESTPGLMVRAGMEQGAHTRLERGTVPTTADAAPDAPSRVLEEIRSHVTQVGAYGETELTRGAISVAAGLRADRLPGESDVTLDPRLAVSTRYGDWTARLSGGVFHQGRWRGDAAIPDAGTPSGLPRTAQHAVFGLERNGDTGFLRAEAFLKRYSDYRAFGAGPEITGSTARGIDVIAQRSSGPITGFVGYSLLDVESRLASGQLVRGAFDVTHSATASVTTALNRDWSVGTTARYGSGAPRTPITGGTSTADGRIEPIYGALMSERLPSYGRLDARVMRYLRTPSFLLTTFVEVLNVTNRANASTFAYDQTFTSREPVHTFFAKRTFVVGGELMFR